MDMKSGSYLTTQHQKYRVFLFNGKKYSISSIKRLGALINFETKRRDAYSRGRLLQIVPCSYCGRTKHLIIAEKVIRGACESEKTYGHMDVNVNDF